MLESKVHLVPEAQKENEGHKEHLVPLGLKVQKEKLVLMEAPVERVHSDLLDHQATEVLLAYQVLLDQSVEEAHRGHKENEETLENQEKKDLLGQLGLVVHQAHLVKEENVENKDL